MEVCFGQGGFDANFDAEIVQVLDKDGSLFDTVSWDFFNSRCKISRRSIKRILFNTSTC